MSRLVDGERPQNTDVHWRAKKGSFNYRCKFDVKLGGIGDEFPRRKTYLRFQAWDQDVVKYSDCLAETTIDLRDAFIQSFKGKVPFDVFSDKERMVRQQRKMPRTKTLSQKDLLCQVVCQQNKIEGGEIETNPQPK